MSAATTASPQAAAAATRARLLVTCVDGPLAEKSFTVTRCPKVVRCVLAADGTADILNEPDDTPRLDEAVHWYRWDGTPAGHVCTRGRGGGCYAVIRLTHAPDVRQLRSPDPINPAATSINLDIDAERGPTSDGINFRYDDGDGITLTADQADELAAALQRAAEQWRAVQ